MKISWAYFNSVVWDAAPWAATWKGKTNCFDIVLVEIETHRLYTIDTDSPRKEGNIFGLIIQIGKL